MLIGKFAPGCFTAPMINVINILLYKRLKELIGSIQLLLLSFVVRHRLRLIRKLYLIPENKIKKKKEGKINSRKSVIRNKSQARDRKE